MAKKINDGLKARPKARCAGQNEAKVSFFNEWGEACYINQSLKVNKNLGINETVILLT
ncbi:MAG: hypothetical protein ABH969_10430 [Pseudomonadota bacterium]